MAYSSSPVKVLFVGGHGRSGSTLVDLMLGQVQGVCSLGEVRHLWQEGLVENRLCGCGVPFRSCPFWAEVGRVAYGGFDRIDVADILALKASTDRWTRIPVLALEATSGRRSLDSDRYVSLLRSLYSAVAQVSGCDVLVDSSKDVSHGYVLQSLGQGFELHVLHLVRDSRAVAYSWARRPKFNPGSGHLMDVRSPVRTALEWSLINALVAAQRRLGPYHLVRYEDMTRHPHRALSELLDFLGIGDRDSSLADDRSFENTPNHTVAGNPNRFERGHTLIRPDEAWQKDFDGAARSLVTCSSAVSLMRYGYPLKLRDP